MEFYALDVETANADYSSICQIGIVHCKNGELVDKWSSLINPEAYFDSFNTSIHGISEDDVIDAPTFDYVYQKISKKISNKITVHHMPFDRVAITRACMKYNLDIIQAQWLDSAKIARRTWEQFASRGYGLANIADYLGIKFEHHNALEDAIAAAKIVDSAIKESGLKINEWQKRVGQPLFLYKGGSTAVKLDGNVQGSLYGENLVFTGSLFLPRRDAAKIAAEIGCNVGNSVSKKTTILVVGTQDSSRLGGYEKSSKHRKTEDLINKGVPIKILSEKDFIEICNNENEELKLEVPEPIQKPQRAETIKVDHVTTEVDFSINLAEIINEKFDKIYENLSEEEKSEIQKADQQYKDLLESIIDCSHSEKRSLANQFNTNLEYVQELYKKYNIDKFEDDDIDVIDSISDSFEDIHEMLFDLKKNKMALAEFYSEIDDIIAIIEVDLEESTPKQVDEFGNLVVSELNKIKETLLSYSDTK